MTSYLYASLVLDLFCLFYLFSINNASLVRFAFAAIFSFVNFKFKLLCKSFNIICYFVRFYHVGTFCARLRARLLVCFDRPVGWKQPVKLHLIKLMRLMRSDDGGYA